LNIDPGRFVFVLRPRLGREKMDYLVKSLELFEYKIANMVQYVPFAELKSWFAVFVGFVQMVLVRTLRRSFYVDNIFKTNKKLFCSELIDNIFKDLGVYLTSRSDNDSMIGPAEMFYSPYLDFVGVLCNKEELRLLEDESVVI
jgi:hypothetical protein